MGNIKYLCKGVDDGEPRKGSPSQEGICFIRLDRKARLVLPLEIRDAIGIKSGDKILLSVSAAGDGRVVVELAKALEDSDSRVQVYSRNSGYLKEKKSVRND